MVFRNYPSFGRGPSYGWNQRCSAALDMAGSETLPAPTPGRHRPKAAEPPAGRQKWPIRWPSLTLYNRVIGATRIAKLAPGTLIRVEVIGKPPKAFAAEPKIGDVLP
jgi:hypothetical protein